MRFRPWHHLNSIRKRPCDTDREAFFCCTNMNYNYLKQPQFRFHYRSFQRNLDPGPDLWVHGHTHNSFDYTLGRTRVVVNPTATRMWRSIRGITNSW